MLRGFEQRVALLKHAERLVLPFLRDAVGPGPDRGPDGIILRSPRASRQRQEREKKADDGHHSRGHGRQGYTEWLELR